MTRWHTTTDDRGNIIWHGEPERPWLTFEVAVLILLVALIAGLGAGSILGEFQ